MVHPDQLSRDKRPFDQSGLTSNENFTPDFEVTHGEIFDYFVWPFSVLTIWGGHTPMKRVLFNYNVYKMWISGSLSHCRDNSGCSVHKSGWNWAEHRWSWVVFLGTLRLKMNRFKLVDLSDRRQLSLLSVWVCVLAVLHLSFSSPSSSLFREALWVGTVFHTVQLFIISRRKSVPTLGFYLMWWEHELCFH